MISAILALGLLGISVPAATSQPLSLVCPTTMDTAPSFNKEQYAGLWYQHARFFDPMQKDTKCVTTEYTLRDDGTISLWNRGFDAVTKAPRGTNAIARIPNTADASKFKIKFLAFKNVPEADYWILGTDYNNYSVVFACKQLTENSNRVRSWILTRNQHPSKDIIDAAKLVATSHGLDTSLYLTTNQTDCKN